MDEKNQMFYELYKNGSGTTALLAAVREVFLEVMGMREETLCSISVCSGGMTNTNFHVATREGDYILRIPGVGTERMINRHLEERNCQIGARIGVNVPTAYFNEQSGIKVTPYIPGARTLHPESARREANMRKTAGILRKLHTSSLVMENTFSVQKEYENYKEQAGQLQVSYYAEYEQMDTWFYKLLERNAEISKQLCPCHNDLVAENLVEDNTGRLYLIDWEYAGMNDPMWDLASHFLECGFSKKEEERFLSWYFASSVPDENRERIAICKMCQDILWSLWTIIKESKGANFGTYGQDRLQRAVWAKDIYESEYQKL